MILVACEDNFQITIKNNTSYVIEISSELLSKKINIAPNEVEKIQRYLNTGGFAITFKGEHYFKRYRFGDTDHWFGVTHNIDIQIYYEELKVNYGGYEETFQ